MFAHGTKMNLSNQSGNSCLGYSDLPLLILHSFFLTAFLNAACPFGSFKASQGDQQCLQCPINSRTSNEGATSCVCRNGYYRTDSDPLQMPCTSMPFSYICFMSFTVVLTLFFENQAVFDLPSTQK